MKSFAPRKNGRSDVIVRKVGDGLQLITQPDHARLARGVVERCVALDSRRRRASVLRATAAHDDGWAAEDAAPTVDPERGTVVDYFRIASIVKQRVWARAIDGLADDPWAAALVAHHAVTVYDRFRGDPEWARFFPELARRRDALIAAGGGTFDELAADYPFVRLGDLISLAFCTGRSDEQRFAEWTVKGESGRVVVSPDPFGGAAVPLAIEGRAIANRELRDDADLRAALAAASPITLRGEAVGGQVPLGAR